MYGVGWCCWVDGCVSRHLFYSFDALSIHIDIWNTHPGKELGEGGGEVLQAEEELPEEGVALEGIPIFWGVGDLVSIF